MLKLIDNASTELHGKDKLLKRCLSPKKTLEKVHKLKGTKLAYKMNRPVPIDIRNDFKALQEQMKELGEDHMEDVMATTKTQAMHVREKELRFKRLRASILCSKRKLPSVDKPDTSEEATRGIRPQLNVRIINDEKSVVESVRGSQSMRYSRATGR